MQVVSRMKNMSDFIDGDVLIDTRSKSVSGIELSALDSDPRRKVKSRLRPNAQKQVKPIKPKVAPRPDSPDKKPEPCRLFNMGKSTSADDGTCPADPFNRLHICSKCQVHGHIARDCKRGVAAIDVASNGKRKRS